MLKGMNSILQNNNKWKNGQPSEKKYRQKPGTRIYLQVHIFVLPHFSLHTR